MAIPDPITVLQQLTSGQYEEALGIPVDATIAQINRAHIRQLHRYNRHNEVKEALNRAKGNLTGEDPSTKARRLLAISQPENALGVLRANLNGNSSGHEYHLIGYTLYQLNRYEEAKGYMETAASIRSTPFDFIWLGNTLERLRDFKNALVQYHNAIDQRGGEIEYRLAGNMYLETNDLDNALQYYQKARESGCEDPELVGKIIAIGKKKRWKKRVALFFRVVSVGKDLFGPKRTKSAKPRKPTKETRPKTTPKTPPKTT